MNTQYPLATLTDSDKAIAYATEQYITTYARAIEKGLPPNVADSVALAAFRTAESNYYAIMLMPPTVGKKVD